MYDHSHPHTEHTTFAFLKMHLPSMLSVETHKP
jgi:hypothetical protein